MEETKDVVTAPAPTEPTAAQIKEQIDAKRRELKATEPAKPVASEPDSTAEPVSPAPEAEPEKTDKPTEAAGESPDAVVPGPAGKDKPEWKAWIEKKGFKGTEDMVRSMRELERELTRKNMAQGQNVQPPPQAVPPPMPPRLENPPPQLSEEEIAKRYNLDPDDLRRVGPLAADIANNIVAQRIGPVMAQIQGLNREVARSAELQSLKEDPDFSNPMVQFEMHQIIEKDPSILHIEPAPYRYAFNEALRNVGRRILREGSGASEQSEMPSGKALPTKPPVTSGGGGPVVKGTPGIGAPPQVNANTFASLPLAEKRKMLEKLGRIPKE